MSDVQYIEILKNFVNMPCERTLACNSLKLRFKEKSHYIWIDPPWEFFQNHNLITTAWDCPHYEDENYEHDFEKWSALFTPLNSTTLTSYEQKTGELLLHFADNYKILIPQDDSEPDSELWYHHWYATNGDS